MGVMEMFADANNHKFLLGWFVMILGDNDDGSQHIMGLSEYHVC